MQQESVRPSLLTDRKKHIIIITKDAINKIYDGGGIFHPLPRGSRERTIQIIQHPNKIVPMLTYHHLSLIQTIAAVTNSNIPAKMKMIQPYFSFVESFIS
jgi:hypothetical protein